ncbi:hypothetical protein [Sphingobium boeckii]|uniref:Uncharacterized protein n=1 Tax=Sphingobium boeckii TaxID=1082345 RepID=A0A7W9AEZ5_9SPHN|nr:hypothetical protein [Sphingobium boeckii]MBB5684327.1 hypothetical protein [Sphingobium boeckii]
MIERPAFANDWPALATEARDALERRQAQLPKLIEQGKGDKAELLRGEIRVWRAIAADWAEITDRCRPQTDWADYVSGPDKLEALAISRARCHAALVKEANALPAGIRASAPNVILSMMEQVHGAEVLPYLAAHRRLDCVEAMLWWQEPAQWKRLDTRLAADIAGRWRPASLSPERHAA